MLISVPFLFLAQTGFADGINFGAGSNTIPDSWYLSMGFKAKRVGMEVMAVRMGREEPTTKPGPEYILDGQFFPISLPIFVKAGLVFGGGKNGVNIGIGADYPLSKHLSIRIEDTQYRVREDYNQGPETENQISIGLQYEL